MGPDRAASAKGGPPMSASEDGTDDVAPAGTPGAGGVGRQREDLVGEQMAHIIDPDNFTPRLLALLSNALVWRESTELRRNFSLGTNDWRILSAVATLPGATASEITEFLPLNKAMVSKSVNTLVGRDLVALVDGPRGSRKIFLTQDGARMHEQMLPISLKGQEIIHADLAPEEIELVNRYLRGMIKNLRQAQGRTDDVDVAER